MIERLIIIYQTVFLRSIGRKLPLSEIYRLLSLAEYFDGVFFLTTNSELSSLYHNLPALTRSGVGTIDEVITNHQGWHFLTVD